MELITLFSENTSLFLIAVTILGLLVGSFLNVVIHRLPIVLKKQWRNDCLLFLAEEDNKSATPNTNSEDEHFGLITPRSRCPHCGHQITALENIPVISYLFLRGKCSECSSRISIRYPVVEILSAILAVAVAWKFGFTIQTALAILMSWALISLSFIDYDHQYLPDNITLPLLWLGLLASLFGLFTDLESAVIGAVAGYLILWSVYKLFKAITGKEGMGYGDFKLLAMFGAWFGWQQLPAIIFLSSIAGAVIGIMLIILKQHDRNKPIPFGPYLAIAGWIAMMWGAEINQAYLRWAGL
ncbi:MAG: A24 family peptidase [Gammaproteobacteria bacterium]|nr:A24 family peptidase [Gammaproteobacteria bacterium]